MLSFEIPEQLRRLEIPGRLTILEGNGSLPKLEVSTDHSTAETYLHSYFFVGDINEVGVSGLKGVSYLDKTDHFAQKTDAAESIRIASEVDRIYLDTPHTVEIHDNKLRRAIRIEKSGSASTVL